MNEVQCTEISLQVPFVANSGIMRVLVVLWRNWQIQSIYGNQVADYNRNDSWLLLKRLIKVTYVTYLFLSDIFIIKLVLKMTLDG